MKIYCKLSGVEFQTKDFPNLKFEGIHPLIGAPIKLLLSRVTDWASGKLDEQERRALFIALLHSTDLVDFRTTAIPNDSVVQRNMELLILTIGWRQALVNPPFKLPMFAVTHDTRRLENIRHWLDAWNNAKNDWSNNYVTASKRARLEQREQALQKLIKNSSKSTDDYASQLAKWALEASNAPRGERTEAAPDGELWQYWTKLFKLKGNDIYTASQVDLDELLEHMEDNLEAGSIYAHSVLKHLRQLLAKNRIGDFGLGIPADVDLQDVLNNPYKIVEDDLETYNKSVAISNAPEEEPTLADYPSKFEYLKAKAAWNLANSKKQEIDLVVAKEQKLLKAAQLENIDAEIDAEFEDEEDKLLMKAQEYTRYE